MLKTILLSLLLSTTQGQYAHWTDKAREFKCKNLESLYRRYKDRLHSLSEKEQQTAWGYKHWYDRNCP